jgi:hypothetical protein
MSKISIEGNASGTGTLTIAAPNTNTSYTLALPEEAGTITTSNSPYSTFRNRIINGGMDIAQRGTSFTSTSSANNDDAYVLDRFYILSDGNDAIDVTQTTTVPTGAKFSIGLDVETTNKKFGIAQIIENANCFDAIGQTVTLSFDAKVSSTTKLDNVKCAIVAWSGTADSVTSDIISAWNVEGTNPTLIANATYENSPANLNVTTSFARYTVSAAVDTSSTTNIIVFIWSDVTDTTAGDFLYITNVQLEVGSVATPFERRPYGTELSLCQRYYYKVFPGVTNTFLGTGFNVLTTVANVQHQFAVPMRVAPSAIEQNGTANNYMIAHTTSVTALSTVPTFSSATTTSALTSNTVSSGLTAGQGCQLRTDSTNGATAFLAWSAEL